MVINGSESDTVNHANSSRWLPLNQALNGEPVRISPGATVVTRMLSFTSSPRIDSDSPVKANLLAQYGTRCATPTLPPIDEMLTMRPPPCAFIAGIAAVIVCSGAQKWMSIASSKSAVCMCSSGPT